jgi:hypothetical protein
MRYEAHSNPAACQRRLTVVTAELQSLRHCSKALLPPNVVQMWETACAGLFRILG